MRKNIALFPGLFLLFTLTLTAAFADSIPPAAPALREIRYDGRLSDDEARFAVDVDVESTAPGEATINLFEGDVALLPAKLPAALQIVRAENRYLLTIAKPGRYKFKLDLVAKIQRVEPWNQVSFTGPGAAIASVTAQATGAGVEIQLLNGTLAESVQTNGLSRVRGFLGADQAVALRWQGKVTEVARKVLLTVDTTAAAQITPTVIKYTTQFHYEIVQGSAPRLTLALPAAQALTRLVGDQIRDWSVKTEGDRQILTVEFIKPVEKRYDLTVFSEQTIEATPVVAAMNPPQPLEVERESGTFKLAAEDTLVETDSLAGLRQVNAASGELAAYRFNARPFTLALKLKRIEPVITVADRVTARLEETRLLVAHNLALNVEKAGIYALELTPQAGFVVAEVRGEGVEDWKTTDGKLHVNFSARVLGARNLEVRLEQPLKTFPETITVAALPVAGATKQTAQIGAASAPGIRLKTSELQRLAEIPAQQLANRTDELLGFNATETDWKLSLASERLAARVVAEVFNLVTVGDGLVGGSATIRYGLVNQGVQEFKISLPAHCKNVEFTGPNIRRKERVDSSKLMVDSAKPSTINQQLSTNDTVWLIGLQDKAWGGYTLVVTYDYQFDPKGAKLPIAGIHAVDVERETGSIAVTTAASLNLAPQPAGDSLHRVDESELATADRALVTRNVLLAYQYAGGDYQLALDVQRHEELPVLEAVADRTEITSVLTEAGEMLTQASFMVKNNEKQFQRFLLPKDATLWGCYVNSQPAKPERDGDWVLVSLPRDVNRDQAFAVDIVYAQTNNAAKTRWPSTLELAAPKTDVPNTYAEWQLYVPASRRVSGFGGSMSVAQGTSYGLLDGWEKFLSFYGQVLSEVGPGLFIFGVLAFLIIALVVSAVRRGWNGVITLLAVVGILAVLSGMLLPALAKAKGKASRIKGVSNLKQVGLAVRLFSGDNNERLPNSFDEMKNELGSDTITVDPETGQRFIYLGSGFSLGDLQPDSVLAYSPPVNGHCNVLLADGSVQMLTAGKFAEMSQRGLVRTIPQDELDRKRQVEAVAAHQEIAGDSFSSAAKPASQPGMVGGRVDKLYAYGMAVSPSEAPATAAASPAPATPPARPSVAGIRSIRIEIPRTGNAFLFTKVLNVGNEPLSVRAKVMSLHAYQTLQMLGQVAAFVLGLAVCAWQWRRARPNTFVLTIALVLVIASVCSLLVAWRALHDVLIVGFPIVTLAVIARLVWKYWPRRTTATETGASESTIGSVPPPIVASLVLLLTLGVATTQAAKVKPSPELAAAIQAANEPEAAGVSILTASYSGTVNDRVAQLDAVLQLSAVKPEQTIALFGENVAVQQFTVKSGEAKLVRDGKSVSVQLGKRGAATVQIRMLVKLGGDVTKRWLTFAIPPALSSQVAFTLDQPDADVDFPTAISFKRTTAGDRTRVDAVIGSGGRVELVWTPRVKRAAEVAATVFCQNTALVTFGGGVVNVRALLDFSVTQGELRQARVRIPAGQRLLRVEGEFIRTWEIVDSSKLMVDSPNPSTNNYQPSTDSQTLVVDLLKGISPAYRLTVETEKVLDALPATVRVETPHALDVKRETGLVALGGADELSLSVEGASDLQRVDADEFIRIAGQPGGGLVSVFRFLKPEFTLNARAETVQPQIEAVVRNNIRVNSDGEHAETQVDYTIKRVGVFALRLALPTGYTVDRVRGDKVQQWTERAVDGGRVLEVALKERVSGSYVLEMELSKNYGATGPAKPLPIAGVHPLGTAKLTTFVAVTAGAGVGVKTANFDRLMEIPVSALPSYGSYVHETGVLAFKSIATEPGDKPDWRLAVNTETVESWVRAEVVNTLTLSETLVSGRAQVRYDIANAPVKELRLKIPAAFKNVEITGANIRRWEKVDSSKLMVDSPNPSTTNYQLSTEQEWRVELQSKTRGFYTLTVTWEQSRDAKAGQVQLTGVNAAGVERETGLLAIVAKSPLQVSEHTAKDLTRVDGREFPDWAGRADDATVLAYRYVRPGYALAVDARRFNEAEVLQALADSARFTTVVADDGQTMTEMSLDLRNNGRQFLEVELPAGATVWSAFVAGQPVRPSQRDGKLLLPLEQSGGDDATVAVTLTYVGTNSFPKNRGEIGFVSPKFDVPLKNARWELFLPPDYDYTKFNGTMTRELFSAAPLASNFSLADYSLLESRNRTAAREEAKQDVSKAKSQLSSGNVQQAYFNYNRAKDNLKASRDSDYEVKELEKNLNRTQANNLVAAQNEFSIRNGGVLTVGGDVPVNGPQAAYDSAAAEQQWNKLAQAQEIAAAKVQPIHVNLPTRGLRYAFTQVLQTGVNKPMSVQLFAANTKTGHWPMRLVVFGFGFALLWAVVAAATARKARA